MDEIEALDAAVFSGEILITNLKELREAVARWQCEINRQEKLLTQPGDTA